MGAKWSGIDLGAYAKKRNTQPIEGTYKPRAEGNLVKTKRKACYQRQRGEKTGKEKNGGKKRVGGERTAGNPGTTFGEKNVKRQGKGKNLSTLKQGFKSKIRKREQKKKRHEGRDQWGWKGVRAGDQWGGEEGTEEGGI